MPSLRSFDANPLTLKSLPKAQDGGFYSGAESTLVVERTTAIAVAPPSFGDTMVFSVSGSLGHGAADPDMLRPSAPATSKKTEHDGSTDELDERGTYAVAEVHVFVNGRALTDEAGLVFDAMRVLVQRDTPVLFDAYSCSCGEAGCAGLFQSVRQSLAQRTVGTTNGNDERFVGLGDAASALIELNETADTVVWRFPLHRQGFDGRLNAGLTVEDGAYVLRFERSYFERLLNALQAHLEDLTQRFEQLYHAPMTVVPDYDPARILHAQEPLLQRLGAMREQFDNRRAFDAQVSEAFGAVYDQNVRAVLPNGRVYVVYPYHVALSLAEASLGEDAHPDALHTLVVEHFGPMWRDRPELFIETLRKQAWSTLDGVVFLDTFGDDDGNDDTWQDLDADAMTDAWQASTFTWVSNDTASDDEPLDPDGS